MSATDTPRTDAAKFRQPAFDRDFVEASFARQLERELSAVQADNIRLERNCYLGDDEEKIALRAELAEARIKLHNMTELYNEAQRQIGALQSERENWRVPSVCRELQAQLDAIRAERDHPLATQK